MDLLQEGVYPGTLGELIRDEDALDYLDKVVCDDEAVLEVGNRTTRVYSVGYILDRARLARYGDYLVSLGLA